MYGCGPRWSLEMRRRDQWTVHGTVTAPFSVFSPDERQKLLPSLGDWFLLSRQALSTVQYRPVTAGSA